MSIQIFKSEKCVSCYNCAGSRIWNGKMEVVCQLETDPNVDEVEADEGEVLTCEVYAVRGVVEMGPALEGDDHKQIVSKMYEHDDVGIPVEPTVPDEVAEQRYVDCIFVGDLLIEMVEKDGADMHIPVNFVEAWNARVTEGKQLLEREIDTIRGEFQVEIDAVKQQIASGEMDWESDLGGAVIDDDDEEIDFDEGDEDTFTDDELEELDDIDDDGEEV